MSRVFVGLALWALLLALAACGGDSNGTDPARDAELADDSLTESIQNKDSDSAKDAEPGENVDAVVPTFDDLPACTRDLNGKTAYVEDEDSAYVCKKGLWVVDDSLTKAVQSDSEKKSSNGKSSSSGKNNPSSPVASSCKTEAGDNCEYGTLTDDRDGQTYKTVKIGEQWWMAENLNYETAAGSYCYGGEKDNCQKYGRLYTWATAVGKSDGDCGYGNSCNLGNVKVRGVCPEGWHLPDTTEWNALFDAVGGKTTAGKMLKSTEGWNDYYESTWNGSDAYSFSALPAGYRYYGGSFDLEGSNAYFWSSTGKFSKLAYDVNLYYSRDDAYLSDDAEGYGFSVRCLKDYGPDAEKKSSNDKSSSSEKNSSSSSVVPTNSSSSSVVPTVSVASPCKTATEDNCEYGTLTDDRDGQTYKTVKIGEQWWMAENLNYAYTGVPFKYVLSTDSNLVYYSDSTSWCYDNDAANCAKYGRLYTWAAAMDSVGTWSTNSKGCGYGTACSPTYPVRGICPEGWHLPTNAEFKTLFTAVGGQSTAGKKLKSTSGWNSSGNGTGAYSFSALPAGYRSYRGYYYYEGYYTDFWSSTENYRDDAYSMALDYNYGDARLVNSIKYSGFSVRCLKD